MRNGRAAMHCDVLFSSVDVYQQMFKTINDIIYITIQIYLKGHGHTLSSAGIIEILIKGMLTSNEWVKLMLLNV